MCHFEPSIDRFQSHWYHVLSQFNEAKKVVLQKKKVLFKIDRKIFALLSFGFTIPY